MKIEIGGGFIGTLTIVFVILKALGYLTWTWWWVFSPLWISALVIIVGILLFLLLLLVVWVSHEVNQYFIRRRERKMHNFINDVFLGTQKIG